MIVAAEERAQEIGQPMNIAVVDAGGNLVSHVRMDGAWIGRIDISIKKALTSRAFDIAAKDLGDNAQPGNHFYGLHTSNAGKIMIFGGGIPLTRDGNVSGGSGEQDQSVGEAGASALTGVGAGSYRPPGREGLDEYPRAVKALRPNKPSTPRSRTTSLPARQPKQKSKDNRMTEIRTNDQTLKVSVAGSEPVVLHLDTNGAATLRLELTIARPLGTGYTYTEPPR